MVAIEICPYCGRALIRHAEDSELVMTKCQECGQHAVEWTWLDDGYRKESDEG